MRSSRASRTYLLRRADEGWSVVVYLNHRDIGNVLANRGQALDV